MARLLRSERSVPKHDLFATSGSINATSDPTRQRKTLKSEPGAQDQHRVEIELRVEGAPNVLGLAETVLLAVEQKIADRNAAFLQRRDHEFGLVRRDDAILRSLEEDDRRREPIDMVDGGAFGVGLSGLWIGTNQPIQVTGLEFVRVAREGLEVADAIIARASAEHFVVFRRERAERRVAAGAAAADHEPLGVSVPGLDQPARAGDAVLDVDEAPLSFEPQPIRAAVAGAAAIVHVEHPNPAARPVLRR